MTDDGRPRRAANPDDAPGFTPSPTRAFDDPDRTIVREPFNFDDPGLFRRPAEPKQAEPTPPEPERPTPREPEHLFRPSEPGVAAHAEAPEGDEEGRRLRSSVLLTLASAVVPGSGLLGARRTGLKALGAVTAIGSIALVGFVGYRVMTDTAGVAKFAGNETFLTGATFALIAIALVWVALILVTHLVTRPAGMTGGRRLIGAIVVGALAFGVAAPTAVAARYTRDATLLLDKVLPDAKDINSGNRPTLATGQADPWADQPRVNILLLGADGNAARADAVEKYGIRTDTIMVASIDTKTGATTLVQIPRNLQHTPFPAGSEMAEAFPDGFRGEPESEWWVSGIWEHVTKQRDDLLQDRTYPGAEALKQGVEGITGLKINYFVMLNIDGLQNLIDAMGGVTVNINEKLAIGGDHAKHKEPIGFLQPGPDQHLGGYDAMWYARSRYNTDDYSRMARQSCLIDAVIDQANPQTLLTRFEAIASASGDMLVTDITQQELSAIIDLAFRVKDAKVSRLVFSPGKNGYSYNNPDFEAMQAAVAKAVAPPATPAATTKPTSAPATTSTKPTATTAPATTKASPTGGASSAPPALTEGSQDVGDACAWHGE